MGWRVLYSHSYPDTSVTRTVGEKGRGSSLGGSLSLGWTEGSVSLKPIDAALIIFTLEILEYLLISLSFRIFLRHFIVGIEVVSLIMSVGGGVHDLLFGITPTGDTRSVKIAC